MCLDFTAWSLPEVPQFMSGHPIPSEYVIVPARETHLKTLIEGRRDISQYWINYRGTIAGQLWYSLISSLIRRSLSNEVAGKNKIKFSFHWHLIFFFSIAINVKEGLKWKTCNRITFVKCYYMARNAVKCDIDKLMLCLVDIELMFMKLFILKTFQEERDFLSITVFYSISLSYCDSLFYP